MRAVLVAFAAYAPNFGAQDAIGHPFHFATIALGAWFACSLAIFFEDLWLHGFRVDVRGQQFTGPIDTVPPVER